MHQVFKCGGRRIAAAILAAAVAVAGCSKQPQPVPAEYALPVPTGDALETAAAQGIIPSVGKWMVAPSGQVANWLGQPVDGKEIYEPINVIIFDPIAKTAVEAQDRLVKASAAANFLVRSGHSSGYGAIIDGAVYPELPWGPGNAFSDEPFVLSNNHGRIFGPHKLPTGWLFVGAFSREAIAPTQQVKHSYESLNRSRDTFAHGMVTRANYKIISFINLGNAILGQPARGTGDHDGVAILLQATQ